MRQSLCLFCILLVAAFAAPAQVLYGSLVGNVIDASSGAVPDAVVVAKESRTGFARETRTNEAGQYQIATLPGGIYEVTITKQGFTTFAARDITVSVNNAR